MQQLVASLIGNVRRESVDGRAYLVAPVSMIVPGVLNGSKGALFYPQDEVERNPGVWNNVPITIGHPYGTNNEAISARDPKTLERFQIGAVYNDRFENGKRVADGWFDEALTKKKAPAVYAALNAGTPMEVSTGLFTDDEPAQNANHNGVAYQFVARNYRPDHLAVLPNQRGACSIQDGCGLNTNGFCPTGEGGGQDNSCSSRDGGGSAPSERAIHESVLSAIDSGKVSDSDFNDHNTGAQVARDNKSIHVGKKVSVDKRYGGGKGYVVGFDKDGSFAAVKIGKDVKSFHNSNLKANVENAAPNQPKSMNTGKFKAMNAGTGRGETHQSAQDGWHGGPRPQDCGCPPGVACNCGMKKNTFCATGDGGGQDNSCGKEGGGSGGTSHKDRLELARANGVGYVVRTKTGYQEETKHGTIEYDKDGKITTFSPKKTSHEKRFAPKRNQRGPKMNREQGVQWLVTNCDCHKGKERVLANADNYSDAEILALVENEQRAQTNQLVVNKFVEAVPGVQSVTLNEIPAFVKGKMKDDGEEETDEAPETADEEMAEEEKPVGNAKKPMTAEQYIAAMPESLRPVWNEMVANSESQRAELVAEVTKIVKNERDPQRRAIVENKLKGKLTNGELKELIALIKPTANSTRREPAPAPSPAPSYFGMQGGPAAQVNNATLPADDLLLDIPTINFADMASPSYKKR